MSVNCVTNRSHRGDRLPASEFVIEVSDETDKLHV